MPVFKAPIVLDASTLSARTTLIGQSVTIVYPGTSDPVTITEYGSGAAIADSKRVVGPQCLLGSFVTPAGVYEVEALAADGSRSYLETAEGSRIAAEEARDQAAEAREAAQGALEQLGAAVTVPSTGQQAGLVLTALSTTPGDVAWQTPTGGGGGGGGTSLDWVYTAGAWPALPTVKPSGIKIVRASGPASAWPTSVPSWVGNGTSQIPAIFNPWPVS